MASVLPYFGKRKQVTYYLNLSYWCFRILPSVLFFHAKSYALTIILLRDMLGKTSLYSIDVSRNDRHILLYYKICHICHLFPFAQVGQNGSSGALFFLFSSGALTSNRRHRRWILEARHDERLSMTFVSVTGAVSTSILAKLLHNMRAFSEICKRIWIHCHSLTRILGVIEVKTQCKISLRQYCICIPQMIFSSKRVLWVFWWFLEGLATFSLKTIEKHLKRRSFLKHLCRLCERRMIIET